MKKYKLEKRDGNEWSLYGIYTERSLPQLVQSPLQDALLNNSSLICITFLFRVQVLSGSCLPF